VYCGERPDIRRWSSTYQWRPRGWSTAAGSCLWVVDGGVEGKCFGDETGLKHRRAGDGARRTGGGLMGGRRWQAGGVDFTVGLREEMERGKERFGGKMILGRKWEENGVNGRGLNFCIFFF
jgi:hypothetical protein